ncbi:MAG: methyltransferase domain-containing protein [Acidimicrobiia bacterium]
MARLLKATLVDPIATALRRSLVVNSGRMWLRRRGWSHRVLDSPGHARARKPGTAADVKEIATVAQVDDDGNWQWINGRPLGLPDLAGRPAPRTRFELRAMVTPEQLSLRKNFAGNRDAFNNELNALQKLGALGLPVPEILSVDFDEPSLTLSFIESAPDQTLPPQTVLELGEQLFEIHRAGLLMGGFDRGSILLGADRRPWWTNFESTKDYSGMPWRSFRFLADADTEAFDQAFEADLPTFERLRHAVKDKSTLETSEWYSPAYLGAGLRIGPLWNLGVGWGRWEFLLRRSLPEVGGMRVLDIGANNGHNALEMLRAGALSVIGVEANPRRIAQGKFLKQAYEWSDGEVYDYRVHEGDMRDIPGMGLGHFDMITALCCLYYLSEPEMQRLVGELSRMTNILVVECNEQRDIQRRDPDTYRRASLDFSIQLLKANGFPSLDVIHPEGYERPLVIGRR